MGKFSTLFQVILFVFIGYVNGDVCGQKIGVYELKKGNFSVKFINYGASIVSVVVPDKYGNLADIVLGFDSIQDYVQRKGNFGAIVGRVANRISNARFTLNGTVYRLEANDGNNTIHGGSKGFSHVIWEVNNYNPEDPIPQINFTYRSFNGEEGFPGDLTATVSYYLLSETHLAVEMKAIAINHPTPVNLAQHAYWNLGGHTSGDILSHQVQIFGSQITPVDNQMIPTGEIKAVQGTPYDFLTPQIIGNNMSKLPNGFDIYYVLDGLKGTEKKKAATLRERKSGRVLELWTTAEGLQFYTGNGLTNVTGKGGFVYKAHAGLCLETQGFPDAVNHPNFPSEIVTKENPYEHSMLFKFSTDQLFN
ncbi:galactose mutarotase-like [Benincasa hispida]|uniref:galactose mutarotase-like n=1 Tax=Benincasa hispida TaxID=102211 RepID=UPI0019026E2B|nr:galactose mutarotase-like [Benincasa hispida]